MPMDASKAQEVIRRAKVEWEGEEIALTFRLPTEEQERAILTELGIWSAENVRKLIIWSVREWDITSGGEPFPITHESLQTLASEFVTGLFHFIRGRDRDPKPLATAKTS